MQMRQLTNTWTKHFASSNLEESYDLWKKAQWDGTTGITQEGDIPWIWLCNIDHLYFVRDGLKVADQKLHPHGHGWSIVKNETDKLR